VFSSRFVRWTRLRRIGDAAPLSDRGLFVVFTARFTDELLSGAWTVLTPTFRAALGLSLLGVGLLTQVLSWVALVIEPVTAGLIDISSRRRLIALGATALAASLLVMGAARSLGLLLVGFALYGLGSGPVAHTADVVVVETFPDVPERAYARATFMDTVGALAGPAVIAAVTAIGLSWRLGLLALAAWAALYSATAASTPLPPPPRRRTDGTTVLGEVYRGLRSALGNRRTRRALLVLFAFDAFEAAFVLKYIWLHDALGLSQTMVALWAAAEQAVDLAALLLLDRWLRTVPGRRLFHLAAGALVVLPAIWVAAPGVAGKAVLAVPLAFARTLIWPLAKSESLVAEPSMAGSVSAVTTLFPLVPFTLAQAALAQAIGTGAALASMAGLAALAMLVAAWWPRRPYEAPPVPSEVNS